MNHPQIEELMSRARQAQHSISEWSQARVDRMVAAVGWQAYEESNAHEMTLRSFTESGLGAQSETCMRHRRRVLGTLRDLLGVCTTGVVDIDTAKGLIRLAKPIGVIAAMTPVTAPTAAICQNALLALKTRNAVVFCPHPRVKKAASFVVEQLRVGLRQICAPVDLLQCVSEPTRLEAGALMAAADLILAAGGSGAVHRAYASGTPAFGAGAGNAVVIVDETADLADAAIKIYRGKALDNGTSCSSESSLIVCETIWDELLARLGDMGSYLCSEAQAQRLSEVIWPGGGRIAPAVVGQDATVIADLAGIAVPDATRVLMVKPAGSSVEELFTREKLSPVLALWRFSAFDEAVHLAQRLTGVHGRGHSCGIHSKRRERVLRLASQMNVSRMMVNQSTGLGNSGDFANGMPFTTTLCCGTWGGSITNENITWKHLLNYTWVSDPIEECLPDVEVVFRDYFRPATGSL